MNHSCLLHDFLFLQTRRIYQPNAFLQHDKVTNLQSAYTEEATPTPFTYPNEPFLLYPTAPYKHFDFCILFLISADGGTDCVSELTEVDNGPEDKSGGGEAASALLDGVTEEGGAKDGSKTAAGRATWAILFQYRLLLVRIIGLTGG